MEIFLDKRAVRQIRISAQDAIEEGDTETLRETKFCSSTFFCAVIFRAMADAPTIFPSAS